VGAEGIAESRYRQACRSTPGALKDPKVIERFASLGTEPVQGGSGDAGGAQSASDRRSAALGRRHQAAGRREIDSPPQAADHPSLHSQSGD